MPTGRLSYRRVSKAALDCALVADDPIECRRSGRRRMLLGSGVQNPRARRLAHAKSPAGGGLSVNESALACRYEMRQPGKSLKWFPRGGAKALGRIVQVRRQTLAEGLRAQTVRTARHLVIGRGLGEAAVLVLGNDRRRPDEGVDGIGRDSSDVAGRRRE